jgi:hypothetical protein
MNYESMMAAVSREWMRQLDVEIGRRLPEIVGHTPSVERLPCIRRLVEQRVMGQLRLIVAEAWKQRYADDYVRVLR